MSHLTDECMMELVYPEGAEHSCSDAEKHLEQCSECRNRLEEFRKTLSTVSCMKEPEAEHFIEKLAAAYEFREKGRADSEIMTPEETAELLRVPLCAIYEMLSELPYLNLAGRIRFRKSAVMKYLESVEHNSRQEESSPADEDVSVSLWRDAV